MKLLLLSLAFLTLGTSFVVGDPVNVTLHYRAFCIDCKHFFKEQLLPVYSVLGDEYLNIDIIPNSIDVYQGEELVPVCYSGEDECKAETYDSCVLKRDYTQKQKIQFMSCIEAADDSSNVDDLKACAEKNDIDWDAIEQCYNNGEGFEALSNYNKIQHSYDKEIDHAPFIMYNGVVDYDVVSDARAFFLEVTCRYIEDKPEACDLIDN